MALSPRFALVAASLTLPAVAVEIPTSPAGVIAVSLAQQAPLHWVSVMQIARSLDGLPPMAVGFDIDDTLLFSSPGGYRGKLAFSPNGESCLKNPAFWEKMSNGWDAFSVPKEVGKALIAMHFPRGDHIYFVTGRSANSTYLPLPLAGAWEEEVIVNSLY
ncbi:HAD family acid phosphatase [Aeromonas caviae]|uniref:HAD family acid phosphatase n=1 Tax=Aeromonas caviae TaxID=648 RepID=UPI0029DA55B5|nr:HAD family acid phosphatase [Aeromonas caviae]MDX7889733.1 HAD family acid phosphatase [Aeromonas caviae]